MDLLVNHIELRKFVTEMERPLQRRTLMYLTDEYSFSVRPWPGDYPTAVLVNDVELALDSDNAVVAVVGYCPYQSWRRTDHRPPRFQAGGLRIVDKPTVAAGVILGLDPDGHRRPVLVTADGWICIGSPEHQSGEAVEFAQESVAVVENGELIAIWLHPMFVPDRPQLT